MKKLHLLLLFCFWWFSWLRIPCPVGEGYRSPLERPHCAIPEGCGK